MYIIAIRLKLGGSDPVSPGQTRSDPVFFLHTGRKNLFVFLKRSKITVCLNFYKIIIPKNMQKASSTL